MADSEKKRVACRNCGDSFHPKSIQRHIKNGTCTEGKGRKKSASEDGTSKKESGAAVEMFQCVEEGCGRAYRYASG